MQRKIRYLSHPQVVVDPGKDVRNWPLSAQGRKRVDALARSNALIGTTIVISSAETKAVETGRPLSQALGCDLEIRHRMHENDRSATGYLPEEEFQSVADQFFARPETSIRGWETAKAAQQRIVDEVNLCLHARPEGDILFVGHGAAGTLLYCHLKAVPISRSHDQGPGGGGCYLEFSPEAPAGVAGWRPMEELIA